MSVLNCTEITNKIQDVFCHTNIYYSVLVYNETLITEDEIQTLCGYLRDQDVPLFIMTDSCLNIQEQKVIEIASQYRMFVLPHSMFSLWVGMQGWKKVIEDVSIVFGLPCDISYDIQKTLEEQEVKTSNDLCLIPL